MPGNSPELNRRRSVHTGAPAIAFRSTLGFAAAVAGASAGRITAAGALAAAGSPAAARHRSQRHIHRAPFQRRSSQPIINAQGTAAGVRFMMPARVPAHLHTVRFIKDANLGVSSNNRR